MTIEFDDLIPKKKTGIEFGDLIPKPVDHGLAAAIKSRSYGIVGDLVEGIARIGEQGGDYMERKFPISGLTEEELQGRTLEPLFRVAEWFKRQQKAVNYQPSVDFQQVKDDPLNLLQTGTFIAEQGLGSIPDMVAAVATLPGYILSRTNNIADERAKNEGRPGDVTLTDMAKAAPGAVVESTFDRFAPGRLLPSKVPGASAPARIGSQVGIQAGTEAIGEVAAYGGESIGTKAGFKPAEARDRALAGAIVGGPIGGATQSKNEGMNAVRAKPQPAPEVTPANVAALSEAIAQTATIQSPLQTEPQSEVSFGDLIPNRDALAAEAKERSATWNTEDMIGRAESAPQLQPEPVNAFPESPTRQQIEPVLADPAERVVPAAVPPDPVDKPQVHENAKSHINPVDESQNFHNQARYEVPAQLTGLAQQLDVAREGLRPGDIVSADGSPFKTRAQAQVEAKAAGKGWGVKKGGGGFVVRHQPPRESRIASIKRPQKQQNQVDTDGDSLFAAIAKLGGIRTDQMTKEWGFDPKEIRTIRGAGTKRISTKNGMSLDRMGEALAELGYLSYDQHGKHDLSELFDLFDGELRGSKHYTPQGYERTYRQAEAARIEELSQADIEASGLDDLSDDARDAIEEFLDDYPRIDQEEDARISALIDAAWDQPVSGMGGKAQQTAGRAAERGDGSAAEANQEASPESGTDQRAADSADSTREIKPPFGDVPFSRSGEANTSALEQLAQEDELFRLPKSNKTTVEGITADNDPGITVRKLTNIPGGTHYEFTMPNGLTAWMSVRPYYPDGKSIYGFDLVDGERTAIVDERPGRNAEAVDGKDDVWINVSTLKNGGGYGAKIYNIAATYAHNTGKVFIGDPAGLLDDAMRRRPEQMLSSALKFGTTEHLAPHPRQLKGDKHLGIPGLDWVYGDHPGNIRKLIELNEKNIANAGGNGGIVYNKKTGQFEDADGNSLTRADIDGMAEVGLGRAAGAGGATLARHALFKSLVQGESGQVRGPDGILVSLGEQLRQHGAAGSDSALRGIFYSKQRANRTALTVEVVHQAIAADTFNHDVDVYPTLADAPAYVREQAEREGATDVEGFWNTRTNRVALIAENLSSAERAREVARHELIGHYGLENMVGAAGMERLAQRVIQAEKDGNKTISQLARQVDATQPGLDGTRRAKEIIAVMAERNIRNSVTRRVLDAIRKFLKSIGFIKQDITDAEIARLLREAQAYLQEQGRASIAGEPALAFSRVEPTDNPAQTMRELAKQAQEEGNGNRTIELGEVAKWEAEAARDAGLAIDGYRHTADVYAIRHALKNHGKAPVEAKRGQLAITEDDIAAIPDVILQPDSIILGVQNARKQELVFSVKNMPDGTLLITEEVRIGRKTLALVSVRKVPGAKNAKALLPSVLPNVRSDTGDNPIIVDAPTGLNPVSFSRTRAPEDPQADPGLKEPMRGPAQGPIRARDFVSFDRDVSGHRRFRFPYAQSLVQGDGGQRRSGIG